MNVKQLIMEEFERPWSVQGYHIYQEVWTAEVGEELVCEREPHNFHYCYQYWLEKLLAMESTVTRVFGIRQAILWLEVCPDRHDG